MSFHSVNCRGNIIALTSPQIMGILNITPDSFSDGGLYNTQVSAMRHAADLVADGAAVLDIGAQSTRPNAEKITAAEERKRLRHIIPEIRKEFPGVLISLDTFWSDVVKFGYDEGIDIVNDISAGQFDPEMFKTVAHTGLPYILMHVNTSYETMHNQNFSGDIILEINRMLTKKTEELLALGVKDIIWDPGFGFGKTVAQQLQMTEDFQFIGFGKWPLLAGISRKSFIYKPLEKGPLDINDETQELHLKLLQKGACFLRVHDAAAARKTLEKFLHENPSVL